MELKKQLLRSINSELREEINEYYLYLNNKNIVFITILDFNNDQDVMVDFYQIFLN